MSSSNATNAPLMTDKEVKATIAQQLEFLEETEGLLESVLEIYREGSRIERYLITVAEHVARESLYIRRLDRSLRARERNRRSDDRKVDTETATRSEQAEEKTETGAEERPGASKRKRSQSDDEDDDANGTECVEEETTPGSAPPPIFATRFNNPPAEEKALWNYFTDERDSVVSYLEYAKEHLPHPHFPATAEGVAAWGSWVARQEADERRSNAGSSRSRGHPGLRDDSLGELLTKRLDDLEVYHQAMYPWVFQGVATTRARGLVADAVAEVESGHYWSDRLGSCACSGTCLLERPV